MCGRSVVDAERAPGDMQLLLAKADPKRNRFTLAGSFGRQDGGKARPVQLYVAGNRQPEKLVVNEVKKEEVVGYLAIPKVKMARR